MTSTARTKKELTAKELIQKMRDDVTYAEGVISMENLISIRLPTADMTQVEVMRTVKQAAVDLISRRLDS